MLNLRILKAKADLLFNVNLFLMNIKILNNKQQTIEVTKKTEQAQFIVDNSREIISLINELEQNLVHANKSYHSLHIEYLKLKRENESLKPKINDLSNVQPNLRTIKIGNEYFDIRS